MFTPVRSLPHPTVAALAALFLVVPWAADRAFASDGAFAVEDAEVDQPGACKVESWLSFADTRDRIGAVRGGCVFNLGRPVELNSLVQRSRSGSVWGTEFTFEVKTNILPVEAGRIGLAIQGGLSFDLLTGNSSGGFVTLPATYEFNDRFKINANLGWRYEHAPDLHWLTWGAGFVWKFAESKPLTLIGEVFGQSGHRIPGEPAQNDPRAQLGLRYTPIETVDFDVIYGRNINGENAHWITVGLNVRFNALGERQAETPLRRLITK